MRMDIATTRKNRPKGRFFENVGGGVHKSLKAQNIVKNFYTLFFAIFIQGVSNKHYLVPLIIVVKVFLEHPIYINKVLKNYYNNINTYVKVSDPGVI